MILKELDNLLNLLENQLPANPSSLKNQGLEKKLQREISKYFKSLMTAFPYYKLDGLYSKYIKESLRTETEDILDPLLATLRTGFLSKVNGHLVAIYMSATAEMVSYGHTQMGVPIAYEGPPISEAISWAGEHCAALVKGLDQETKNQLANLISDGIKNKRGIPGLTRDIKKTFDGMSRYRSQMIARTETANALGESFLQRGREMGIEGKEWVASSGSCPICLNNAADGIIPFNRPFSSGHMTIPAHPNCTCTCAPANLPK